MNVPLPLLKKRRLGTHLQITGTQWTVSQAAVHTTHCFNPVSLNQCDHATNTPERSATSYQLLSRHDGLVRVSERGSQVLDGMFMTDVTAPGKSKNNSLK